MKKKGFTLIELIGVVSILGIILIVALPQIGKTLKDQA
ncbi:MAG: prepilin-type N-terminal cleavage/methylation domain-containing protein, partial [Firmicutes bacterium]|nr:prepilin-type N-terminal cleavage/methylation domain-containing protein [Bacillota bacterium]